MPVYVTFHHRSRCRGAGSSVDLNNKCDRLLSDASPAYTRYIVANNCGVASVTKNTRPRALRNEIRAASQQNMGQRRISQNFPRRDARTVDAYIPNENIITFNSPTFTSK